MELKQLSDEELAKEWQKNSNYEVATVLYQRYEKKLMVYFYAKTGDYHSSQDLLNDTFIRVANYIHSFHFKGSFKSWLFAIANNLIKVYYHKKQLSKAVNIEEIYQMLRCQDLEFDDQDEALKACLKEIPERDREITILKHGQELTLMEIAKLFELSPEGVRKIIANSLQKLHKCLQKKFGML